MTFDAFGDGSKSGAQVCDLGGQARQAARVGGAGVVLLDDGAEVGVAVKRGSAQTRPLGDGGEGDRLPGGGQFAAGVFNLASGLSVIRLGSGRLGRVSRIMWGSR